MTYTPEKTSDLWIEALDTHSSRLTEIPALIDLRKAPRVQTQLPAEAVSGSDDKVLVIITNLSHSGLRLEGCRQTVAILLPNLDCAVKHTPCSVQFSLPSTTDQLAAVKVQCEVVYVRCERDHDYQVGIKFVGFDEGREALDTYLLSQGINSQNFL